MSENLSEKEKHAKKQRTELHAVNEKLPTERKQVEEQLQTTSLYTRNLLDNSVFSRYQSPFGLSKCYGRKPLIIVRK